MTKSARVLDRKSILRGRVFDLAVERVLLPNGVETKLEILRHPGAAAVVPITRTGEIVLLRQYRYAVDDVLWEIPAGTLEAGESPEACARRELEEEAGMAAGEWLELGTIVPVPGYSSERIWLFAARGLRPCAQRLERDELVSEVRTISADEALRWLADGTIIDAKTSVALFRAHARGLLGSPS